MTKWQGFATIERFPAPYKNLTDTILEDTGVAFTVSIELNREIELAAPFDDVFALMSDVPRLVRYFPKVEKLEDLGDNTWQWEMEKIGVDKYSIRTVYACRYEMNRDAGKVTWVPVEGLGNGRVGGSWTLVDNGQTTRARYQTSAELTLPMPSLLKMAVSPVVKHEFNGLVDTYLNNLKKAF